MSYERSKCSQDLSQTSSGRSLKWVKSQNFPNMDFTSRLSKNIPDVLLDKKCILSDHYNTTNNNFYNYKAHTVQQNGYPMSKPLAHYEMKYNKDLHEKLLKEKLRRPLSMANQKSETLEEFGNKMDVGGESRDVIKDFSLQHHYNFVNKEDRPLSSKYGTLPENKKHLSVLLLNDPYLTTNQTFHRPFQQNHFKLPTRVARTLVKGHEEEMRDRLTFKIPTHINTTPPFLSHVPNNGFTTDYKDNYKQPLFLRRSQTSVCLPSFKIQSLPHQQPPLNKPHQQQLRRQTWDKTIVCDNKQSILIHDQQVGPFPIVNSYNTEAQTCGSKRKVFV